VTPLTVRQRHLAGRHLGLIGLAVADLGGLAALGGLDWSDVAAAGHWALLLAARGHDPALGAYPTYARQCVRRELLSRRRELRREAHPPGAHGDGRRVTVRSLEACGPDGGPLDPPDTRWHWPVPEAERQALLAAVAVLPEPERQAVELLYWQGRPLKAIARRLGMTRQGLQRLLCRALVHLRRLLHRSTDVRTPQVSDGT
jgi:RNA polymerase sigma factor (sigma-70 family)